MNPFSYIKNKGIKRALEVIYKYKIDIVERKSMSILFKRRKLLNIIVIESHNDFDCNGGAFYDYLLQNKKNDDYKIIWLLKNKVSCSAELPHNVIGYYMYRPNIMKNYYITRAKYLFADETIIEKNREDQISLYLTHGGITFKDVRGHVAIPNSIDYILSPSKNYDPLMCKNYSIPFPNKRMLHVGMPKNDCIFKTNGTDELLKLNRRTYSKTILWMPTFRKLANSDRNDSVGVYPLGLPLFESLAQLKEFDKYLGTMDTQLIVKLHPFQDLTIISKIPEMENIRILDDMQAKSLNVNIYRLMPCVDALVSDYSSVAYSFLLLDKPLGFILSDLKDYKMGFIRDDLDFILPGKFINTIEDFQTFIDCVLLDKDDWQDKRHLLRGWLYEYCDGESCRRLMNFLNI